MSNTLPVPSKAALRTLRRIALGTSCTVAFTTGLLTEDRRRRIHAAREVHNNAKKLRSSRQYHGGTPSIESFEDQAMRYNEQGYWLAKDSVPRSQAASSHEPPNLESKLPPRQPPSTQISENQPISIWKSSRPRPIRPVQSTEQIGLLSTPPPTLPTLRVPKLQKVIYKPRQTAKALSLHRQSNLGQDVIRILDSQEEATTDAAAARFFEAFEEGLSIEGVGFQAELVEAAAKLSKACQLEGNFEASEKILRVLTTFGPIDEDLFHSLGIESIVKNLLNEFREASTGDFEADASNLQKAVALYLTKFKGKPGVSSDSWRRLGENLCAATFSHGLSDSTLELYWRLEKSRGDAPNVCFHYLLGALKNQDRHNKVVSSFRRLFAKTQPQRSTFVTVGDIAFESALQFQDPDLAEEILLSLAHKGEELNLRCSTKWFLQVLRSDWNTFRDITKTKALLERLESYFHLIPYCMSVYGAMIQFCVEAGDEVTARWYYENKCKALDHMPLASRDHVRIQGHFAYAKAMRSDWEGVENDFREMRLSHDNPAINASFPPIFKLFARTHAVDETEDFLRTFIDQGYVLLTPYMSQTMISKYAAAKEIDSIFQWLDYMTSVNSPADAMFFNTLLDNCRTKWRFSFDETYGLYQKIRKMDGVSARFTNESTFSLLRRAAIGGARSDVASAVRNLNRLKLDRPLSLVRKESTQEHMAIALAKGNPQRALRIYERALKTTPRMDIACTSIAVRATLQVDPSNLSSAALLLRKPQEDGRDISAAAATLFVHQLSHQFTESAQNMAKITFAAFESRGIEIHPSMITHTMHMLVNQGLFGQALQFWEASNKGSYAQTLLDLPTLTVILRAYVAIRDCTGVEWVIQALSDYNMIPDKMFMRPLLSYLSQMRGSSYLDPQFHVATKNALDRISAIRREATKDKEHVKTMTFNIMEKAIEIDRKLALNEPEEVTNGMSRTRLSEEHNCIPNDEELKICNARPVQKAEMYVRPGRRLVVAAG